LIGDPAGALSLAGELLRASDWTREEIARVAGSPRAAAGGRAPGTRELGARRRRVRLSDVPATDAASLRDHVESALAARVPALVEARVDPAAYGEMAAALRGWM